MGKIYIVGLGPGSAYDMTLRAKNTLDMCGVIVGYKTYIDLIKPLIGDKLYISTGMKQEVERCEQVLNMAVNSKDNICLISSGDSGIYGMAGIMLEKAARYPEIDIEIIPGITAAISASAMTGAPLMNDFVVISLSDLMTPWKTIEKRIELASMGDFVISLYNPKSKSRTTQLTRAVEIILKYKAYTTPVAIVKNAGRVGEQSIICMLTELTSKNIDMSTTIIIGNSKTYILNNRMITSRGYIYS